MIISVGSLSVSSLCFSIAAFTISLSSKLLLSIFTLTTMPSPITLKATFFPNSHLFPSFLLSGFIFPRENMPFLMYVISYFVPLTYFLEILRGIILRGAGFVSLLHDIIPLTIFGTIVLLFAIRRFKKQIA